MHCPKCGDVLEEVGGKLLCVRGEMELSQHLAKSLRECYVDKVRLPKEPPPVSEMTHKRGVGGGWFCPGCGIATEEKTPWNVSYPQCRRGIWEYLYELIEFHPHRREDGSFR